MKSKLFLIMPLLAVFLLSTAVSTAVFNLNPATTYAAPKDDARNEFCEGKSNSCITNFNTGFDEQKAGKNLEQACGIEPPSSGGGRGGSGVARIVQDGYAGCVAGFNFARTGNVGSNSGSVAAAADESPGCDGTIGKGSILGWIICPIIDIGVSFTDFVFKNLVEPLLVNNPIETERGTSIYDAWQGFRLLANILLVGILLIIVFAQAWGRDNVASAYMIKKMAPRILLGVIAINLSIYLVTAAIDITNVIGKGLGELLRSPFVNSDTFSDTVLQGNFESSVAAGAIGGGLMLALVGTIISAGGLLAGLSLALGGIGLLLLLLIMAITAAALGVVATVVIRYGLIVLLSLLAPIAIACYILPGTEKYFRSWWSLFSKTLLVYPIIAVIFAMSDVMAAIFLNMQPNDSVNDVAGLVAVFISIFAIYAPIFLIPFAFKFAGGVIGGVYDFSKKGGDAFSRGLFGSSDDPDSLRARKSRELKSGLAANDLSGKAIGARINPFLRGDRRRSTLAGIRTAYGTKYAEEASKGYFAKTNAQVDEAQMDMATYKNAAASRSAIADGSHVSVIGTRNKAMRQLFGENADWDSLSQAQRNQVLSDQSVKDRQGQIFMYSSMNDQVGRTTAARAAAAKSGAALSYGYAEGEQGWQQAVNTANDIFGGNDAEVKNFLNEFQYVAKQVGRADLSGNVNSTKYDGDRAFKSVTLQQHGSGKPSSIEGALKWHQKMVKEALAGVDSGGKALSREEIEKRLTDAAVFSNELTQVGQYGTGAARDAAVNARKAMQSIDAGGGVQFNAEDTKHIVQAVYRRGENTANPANPLTEQQMRQMAEGVRQEVVSRSRTWDPMTSREVLTQGASPEPPPNQQGGGN